MPAILQSRLPYDPAPRALPGMQPMALEDWLHRDEAFAGQMAERDRLIAQRRDDVIALDPGAAEAAAELLALVLGLAYPGAGDTVHRPDGVQVPIAQDDPMATLGRLVQEDLLIHQKRGDEHVLTGAVLCFPARWTLAEKFLQPLARIHRPVAAYDDAIARRVQRLFDGVQAGRPLWRHNALWYDRPDLFQPRRETERRTRPPACQARYLRSERQGILRLPRTGGVVFSVHTYVLPAEAAAVRPAEPPRTG